MMVYTTRRQNRKSTTISCVNPRGWYTCTVKRVVHLHIIPTLCSETMYYILPASGEVYKVARSKIIDSFKKIVTI